MTMMTTTYLIMVQDRHGAFEELSEDGDVVESTRVHVSPGQEDQS